MFLWSRIYHGFHLTGKYRVQAEMDEYDEYVYFDVEVTPHTYKKVATVRKGIITAKKKGKATITVKCEKRKVKVKDVVTG